jgi:hypothetical protein
MRKGLVIAQDSGNRYNETSLANVLGRLEARHGDPLTALDYLNLAIGNYHDSGNVLVMRVPLSVLAMLLQEMGRAEPAAAIAGYAVNPHTAAWLPEIGSGVAHLREALGESAYESLARKGEAMTTAEMVTYAYDQIDQARAELNAVLNRPHSRRPTPATQRIEPARSLRLKNPSRKKPSQYCDTQRWCDMRLELYVTKWTSELVPRHTTALPRDVRDCGRRGRLIPTSRASRCCADSRSPCRGSECWGLTCAC